VIVDRGDRCAPSPIITVSFLVDSVAHRSDNRKPEQGNARAAARLAARLAESVAPTGGGALLECLSPRRPAGLFGQVVADYLDEALRTAKILRPSDGSAPVRPSRLKRLGIGCSRLERDLLTLLIRTRDLVRSGDEEDDEVAKFLEVLGTAELEWAEIADRVDLSRSTVSYTKSLQILARWLALGSSAPVFRDSARAGPFGLLNSSVTGSRCDDWRSGFAAAAPPLRALAPRARFREPPHRCYPQTTGLAHGDSVHFLRTRPSATLTNARSGASAAGHQRFRRMGQCRRRIPMGTNGVQS
jgi:hypothetical protein